MVKKTFPNILLMVSMLVALLHSVVPHHEHGEMICFEVSHCEGDHQLFASHNDSELATIPHQHHPQSCCSNTATGLSSNRQNLQQDKHSQHIPNQFAFLLWGYLSPLSSLYSSVDGFRGGNFSPYKNFYTSILAFLNHGLRAPPIFFS
jgi:hypothetical protein